MASQISNDGEVILPFNISRPAPVLDLNFEWATAGELNHAPVEEPTVSEAPPQDDQQPIVAHAAPTHLSSRAAALAVTSPLPQQEPDDEPSAPPPAREPVPPGQFEFQLAPPTKEEHDQFEFQMGFTKPRNLALPFPLNKFTGTWAGNGYTSIFVPFPFGEGVGGKGIPPTTPDGLNDNRLILDLTTEQWTFGPTLGDIPSRGFGTQDDIHLQGLPYLQAVQRVTNNDTGKPKAADLNTAEGIHFEPGVWLFVPAAKTFHTGDPLERGSIVRMASIPHGTTINAQGVVPKQGPVTKDTPLGGVKGKVEHGKLDTRPFHIGNPTDDDRKDLAGNFPSMRFDPAKPSNGFRKPKNLKPFVEANTITPEVIQNPNLFLKKVTDKQQILDTVVFEVHTGAQGTTTPPAVLNGGGTTNISFLAGKQGKVTTLAPNSVSGDGKPGANAHAESMTNKWWIQTVLYDVEVGPMGPNTVQQWRPKMLDDQGNPSTAPTPVFNLQAPPSGIKKNTVFKVPGTQIQYSQTVNLNFGPLTWPHVSVATLVPKEPQPSPTTAFKLPGPFK